MRRTRIAQGSPTAGAWTIDPATSQPSEPIDLSSSVEKNESGVIRFRRQGLAVGEIYFVDRAQKLTPPVDYLRTLAVLEPAPELDWRERQTLLIRLTSSDDEILGQMAKGTRYEVQRAMKSDSLHVEVHHAPTPDRLIEFADYYDLFAQAKGLSLVYRPRLEALARNGMLTLSRVSRDDDRTLAWHAYGRSTERAMLMQSASLFRDLETNAERNLAGRANRCLHWQDMLAFKALGCAVYDIGGVDLAGRDPATARIAAFKRGFGGEVRTTYWRSQGVSARGRIAAALLRARRSDF
jgi:hypothetical protein